MAEVAKVLVTGGAGYIGSVTTRVLLQAGYVVVDSLSQGHRAAVPREALWAYADLANKDALRAVFAAHPDIYAVMHFAAHTQVGASMKLPFKNACNLLEVMLEHGVKRFIFSSTANLFDLPPEQQAQLVKEESPIVPGSPYGEGKFFVERILHWLHRIYDLRYFNAASYPTRDSRCVRNYIRLVDPAQTHLLVLQEIDQPAWCAQLQPKQRVGLHCKEKRKEMMETAQQFARHLISFVVIGLSHTGDPVVLIASLEHPPAGYAGIAVASLRTHRPLCVDRAPRISRWLRIK